MFFDFLGSKYIYAVITINRYYTERFYFNSDLPRTRLRV